MRWNEVETLLERYYKGATSESETKYLFDLLITAKDLPDHLKEDKAVIIALNRQKEVELDAIHNDDWLLQKVRVSKDEIPGQKHVAIRKLWIAAAIAVVISGSFLISLSYLHFRSKGQETEIAGLRKDLQEIKQVLLTSSSSSNRIGAVSRNFDPGRDEQVIDLLIKALDSDENINVRLAACESLYQFRSNEKARDAFIQSLQKQTDPVVQLLLIDVLIGMKEKKAMKQLKQLKLKQGVLPDVRQKAEQGLNILTEI